MLFDLGSAAPYTALALIVGIFIVFTLERRPPDMVAFCGAALALFLGLVSVDDVLKSIANPATATIAAMFVLSAALVRTGVLDRTTEYLRSHAAKRPIFTLLIFFAGAATASAFMNNTPVVIVLIPVIIALSRDLKVSASRFLIPLSYMVILGGTCSLIGTSTNLLVDGIAQNMGMKPFTLFEIAPLGIIIALVCGAYLAVAAPRLLPDRVTVHGTETTRTRRTWLVELFVPAGSHLIGRSVKDVNEFRRGNGRVIDVVRGDLSLRIELETVSLLAGDVVVIKTTDTEIMGFRNGAATGIAISGTEASTARPNTVIEVLVGPDSRALGKTIGRLRWRRRYGVYPMALHRKGSSIDLRLSTQRLEVGDTLLLDGAVEDITRLSEDEKLIVLSTLTSRAYRRKKAPIAIAIMAGVVGLAALNVAPILTLALIGAALAFLTKCVDPDEGMESIDGRLLLLIVSMLILGVALDRSGALKLIIDSVTPFLLNAHPLVALAVVYAATSILTEVITNNAVAVVMTPIAAGIAIHLGYDPRCFVVAAMFGASASFSTPIGYQTNTLVYNAGGYRFTDFLRIGIPMNLICGITTVLIAPLIWPLVP